MSSSTPDDYAHLSADIILDVLEIGCPGFDDLAGLDGTDGRWGDVVRSGRFSRGTTEIGMTEWKRFYRKEFYKYGLVTWSYPVNFRAFAENSCDLVFTHVMLDIGAESTKFENWLLRHATRRVSIGAENKEERIPEIIDILATRPISDLDICSSSYSDKVHLRESLPRLLKNPHLRRFCAGGKSFERLDLLEAYVEFVKMPNFTCLDLEPSTEISQKLMPIVLDYWKKLTVFPSHMQGIRFGYDNIRYDWAGNNAGFTEITSVRTIHVHSVYYMDHPNDSSKRIECFFDRYDKAQLCLTSKEDTVFAEFEEYSFSDLRKHIHKCGSFDPKCW